MPSTVIATCDYDPETKDLTVIFTSGLTYRYKLVPEKVFKELRASGSKGRYLNFHIKGTYTCEKIEKAQLFPKV